VTFRVSSMQLISDYSTATNNVNAATDALTSRPSMQTHSLLSRKLDRPLGLAVVAFS